MNERKNQLIEIFFLNRKQIELNLMIIHFTMVATKKVIHQQLPKIPNMR